MVRKTLLDTNLLSKRLAALGTVSATALAFSTSAIAQDAASDAQPEASQPEALDDNTIIVTADRREQSLQDFAGTAFVVTGEELLQRGVQDFTDLQDEIPGLSVANNGGNVEVFIRGIGSSNNTELGDPAASFHFDGVNIPRPSGIGSAFYDIERVEVNVGPQGTLRGRNATAGSVNAISFKPGLGIWDAGLEAEYGNYNQRSLRGALNIPIGENVAVRFAGLYLAHDSYYNNVGPVQGIGVAEEVENFSGRAQILFKPTDRLTVVVAGDYISEGGTGYTGTNYALPLGEIADGNLQSLDQINDPRDVIARGITPDLNTDHWGIRSTITYETDDMTIEYIGSYRDAVYDYEATTPLSPNFPGVIDALSGGAGNPNADIILQESLDNFSRFRIISDSRSQFHELRLFNTEGPWIWSVGAQYINEKQFSFLGSTGDRTPFFSGIEFNTNTDSEAWAVYGDMTYSVTDRFRLTGGARVTKDKKERNGVAARYAIALGDGNFNCCLGVRVGTEGFEFAARDRTIINPDTDADGTISDQEVFDFYANGIAQFGDRDNLDEILNFGPFPGFFGTVPGRPDCLDTNFGDGLTCNGFEPSGQFTFGVPFQGQIFQQDGNYEDEFFDWRLRGEYDITDDHLVYALVSNGHKSGGFNDNLGDLGVAPTYETESVVLYELGSKNEFYIGDVRARLNGSIFYNDYSDQVFTSLLSVAQAVQFTNTFGGQTITLPDNTSQALIVSFSFNAADSEIYGAQIDGGFDLPANISLDFSALYLEAQIKKAEDIQDFRFQADVDAANAVFRSIEGRRLPRTPKWQLNAKLSQVFELPTGQLDYVISAGYRSSQFHTIFNSLEFDANGNASTVTDGRLLDKIDGYFTMDIGAGYTIDDAGKYRIEAYANNVTNSVNEAAIIITQFDNTRFFTRPRTYGVRVRARF
ncbi:TonB-dependent receptor [Pontixanthobacter rizhaonensis]|uniref:TonB-dependent receptor n=1 Tax=Pontixanthobacter rizhaonensis TaxID=2730337 RepID=UPI001B8AEE34|nr:TonB-dependent receptor [Pontixanthobacter rizhaonensis]